MCSSDLGGIFFVIYFLVFVTAQFIYVPKALINNTCTSTLNRESPTKNNVLGVLGSMNLGIDCVFFFISIYACIQRFKTEEDEEDY